MTTCKERRDLSCSGFVHSFETLGALDGPGIRTVVFLSGCPMRCAYCHNPDTWQLASGTKMKAEEVFHKVQRYKPYFKENGGITLSGGEPLMQAGFAVEIFRLCQADGIHTALDTSGAIVSDAAEELLELTDLVILDIKHTDPEAFLALTGYEMRHVLRFLQLCRKKKNVLWLRQVIVPGITDNEKNILALRKLAEENGAEKIELLPYHTHGVFKWEKLSLPYPLAGVQPPEESSMKKLRNLLK